ncbi:DUF3310 domain-containing protein [Campylobacter coli]|uniref:DUF3310 domain-containing protein n=1 Tax=Campylobacter coli TaxID=195 RepID=UPI004034D7B2
MSIQYEIEINEYDLLNTLSVKEDILPFLKNELNKEELENAIEYLKEELDSDDQLSPIEELLNSNFIKHVRFGTLKECVEKPSHYLQYGFESRELQTALLDEINISPINAHNIATAIKYVVRCKFKENYEQDLSKAIQYLKFCSEKIEFIEEIRSPSIKVTKYLKKIEEVDLAIAKGLTLIVNYGYCPTQSNLDKAISYLNKLKEFGND